MRLFVLLALVACATRATPSNPGDNPTPGLGPQEVEPTDALAPGACDDVPLYTLADLAAGKGADERIAIDVVPVANIMCTLLHCGDAECCNGCGGSYGARLAGSPDLELRLDGLKGCSGMDCNLHCEPFGRKPTKPYRFVGMHTFTLAGQTSVYHKADLKVERYCRL